MICDSHAITPTIYSRSFTSFSAVLSPEVESTRYSGWSSYGTAIRGIGPLENFSYTIYRICSNLWNGKKKTIIFHLAISHLLPEAHLHLAISHLPPEAHLHLTISHLLPDAHLHLTISHLPPNAHLHLAISHLPPNAHHHLTISHLLPDAHLHLAISRLLPEAHLHLAISHLPPEAHLHLTISHLLPDAHLHLTISHLPPDAHLHLAISQLPPNAHHHLAFSCLRLPLELEVHPHLPMYVPTTMMQCPGTRGLQHHHQRDQEGSESNVESILLQTTSSYNLYTVSLQTQIALLCNFYLLCHISTKTGPIEIA